MPGAPGQFCNSAVLHMNLIKTSLLFSFFGAVLASRGSSVRNYCYLLKYWDILCLSIGTPPNNKFSICSKWKIYYFEVSQNVGTLQPNNYNVQMCFGTNGKVMVLGVPILKHFRIYQMSCIQNCLEHVLV